LDGTPGTVQTALIGDPTDANAIEAAIAAALDSVAGISASVNAGVVVWSGDNGRSVAFDGLNTTFDGTWAGQLVGIANGTDVAKNTRLDIGGTTLPQAVTAGEQYSVLVTLAEGLVIGANYVAVAGDTTQQVAQGLAATFNAAAAPNTVNAVADSVTGAWGITFTDEVPDDGAFVLTKNDQGTYGGSGASDIGATALNTADVVTDFQTGVDKIDLGIVPGSGTNYFEIAAFADFATARAAAIAKFDGNILYYLTASTADNTGLLFFDANADGTLDGVVSLTGVTEANFASGDIIAAP
jgi:hypothetical protein